MSCTLQETVDKVLRMVAKKGYPDLVGVSDMKANVVAKRLLKAGDINVAKLTKVLESQQHKAKIKKIAAKYDGFEVAPKEQPTTTVGTKEEKVKPKVTNTDDGKQIGDPGTESYVEPRSREDTKKKETKTETGDAKKAVLSAKVITKAKQVKAGAPWLLPANAVWVQRVAGRQNPSLNKAGMDFSLIENFGNPFLINSLKSDLPMEVPLGDAETVSLMYYNWLTSGTIPTEYPKEQVSNLDKRRNYILENLEKINDAKELWYWRGPDEKITHVDALVAVAADINYMKNAEVTNTDDRKQISDPDTKEQQVKESSTTESDKPAWMQNILDTPTKKASVVVQSSAADTKVEVVQADGFVTVKKGVSKKVNYTGPSTDITSSAEIVAEKQIVKIIDKIVSISANNHPDMVEDVILEELGTKSIGVVSKQKDSEFIKEFTNAVSTVLVPVVRKHAKMVYNKQRWLKAGRSMDEIVVYGTDLVNDASEIIASAESILKEFASTKYYKIDTENNGAEVLMNSFNFDQSAVSDSGDTAGNAYNPKQKDGIIQLDENTANKADKIMKNCR